MLASLKPPKGMSAAVAPQFILLAHMGAVGRQAYDLIGSVTGTREVNGCLVRGTMFATLEGTSERTGFSCSHGGCCLLAGAWWLPPHGAAAAVLPMPHASPCQWGCRDVLHMLLRIGGQPAVAGFAPHMPAPCAARLSAASTQAHQPHQTPHPCPALQCAR